MPSEPQRMMAARKASVHKYYELVDSNDVDGLLALFDDDAVYHRPGYRPLRGRDELRHFYKEERVISYGEHVIDSMVVDRDRIAVQGTFRGTLRTGEQVQLKFADFFGFAHGVGFGRRDTFFFTPMV